VPAADASDEISSLIETLLASEQRLEELTGGEVDTVAGRDGQPFLLRRAQEQARNSEAAKQSAILNALPAQIALLDTQGIIISVNEAWRRFANGNGFQDPGHGVGTNYLGVCDPSRGDSSSDAHRVAAGIRAVLDGTEKSFSLEYPCHAPNEQRWFLLTVTPLADERLNGAVVMHLNITERKRAAALLAESGQRLALAKDSARIGIWEWEVESNKLVWDAQMYLLYGIREQDFSGAYDAWQNGVHPEDRKRSEAEIFAAVDGVNGFHTEFRVVWPDGEVRHIEAHATVYRTEGGNSKRMIGVNWDITERKRADENVQRLAAIVESSADAIISKTLQGIITSWNPAAEKMFGYAAAEIIGQPLLVLLPPDRTNEEAEILAGFARGELVRHFETVRLRKGGQSFEVSVTISPIKDAAGKINGASKIVRDITDFKKLEQQFRQVQKMENFGQLAGGVAHDFNNILAVMKMQLDLFKDDERFSPEQVDCAHEIGVSIERATALTRQLLLFSRKEILQLRDLDLNQSINGMTNMLRRILGADIEVQFRFSLQLMGIHADAGMVDQVLMNLAVNSRDAMPKGGQLIIETSALSFEPIASPPPAQGRPGKFVCLTVSDNGCGIPAENLARIFEPFFTTKPAGQGTGLGLATLLGIVQLHKGWVNVDSEVARGTSFRIYFPRVDKLMPAPQKPVQPKLSSLPGGSETILLVEDDDFLRPSVCNTLSRLGYHVIPVSNGIKALEIWQARREDIQMLITDLVIPGGITGKQLAEQLLKQNPQLKVLYASGYSADIVGTDFPLKEGVNFLIKPFHSQKIAQTIRDKFDRPA
jgi:PAS domain S-box-containing protein